MSDAKTIWIYRRYGDIEGMGEYVSWKPEGFDRACEYIAKSDHDRIVAELRAELFAVNHKLTKHRAANQMLETTIARQARVIEIAKRVLHNAGLRPPDGGTPTVETICEDLNDAIIEIAAIERGGES